MRALKDELNAIYKKMGRLSSFAYPEYKEEETVSYTDTDGAAKTITAGSVGDKLRMKPPLLKMRLGDLFGSGGFNDTAAAAMNAGDVNFEVTGFLKTLSYSYPDTSPWEIQSGRRVPKYVEVEIGYQIIHGEVPSLSHGKFGGGHQKTTQQSFYGINQVQWNQALNSAGSEEDDDW